MEEILKLKKQVAKLNNELQLNELVSKSNNKSRQLSDLKFNSSITYSKDESRLDKKVEYLSQKLNQLENAPRQTDAKDQILDEMSDKIRH